MKIKNTNNINNFIYLDDILINKIKQEAKNKFINQGIYKDAYIIKNYIKHLGEFGDNTFEMDYFKRIINFLAEKWINVELYLEEHKISDLEELQHAKCTRPLLRVNSDTPITINEILKLHGKKKILDIIKMKKSNERINWRLCKINI